MVSTKEEKSLVLIIEDDPDICRLVAATLEEEGYSTVSTADGLTGLREFFQRRPDLVLLDISLPRMNGWEVCQRIREVSEIPIVMLTAAGREQDRVRGLNMGADDYISKPFGGRELVARVTAALRRYRTPAPEQEEDDYADAKLRIDFRRHVVYVDGQLVSLSPTEFRLLAYLVRNRGQALTHDQILEQVWGDNSESFDSVKQYISYLRHKLGDDPETPQIILTVRGTGYRYNR
ncbi:MAG: response regulator transcription factor [Chloroflexi bacterium]|nr:response regulator transcription factor [Chloroflexota bacterium]